MEWMTLPLRRYADFSGRSRRKEFWMFLLGYMLLGMAITIIFAAFGAFSGAQWTPAGQGIFFLVIAVLGLGLFIPSLAVYVRRFHDQDRSGWWVLLAFVPYLGGLILIVFMCIEGTRGPNRFGPDPKG